MAGAKSLSMALAEVRSLGRVRQRRPRVEDAALPIARLIAACRTVAVEERAAGLVFRLAGETEQQAGFTITCTLHAPASPLTTAESRVVELLCEGRTRAQIARLRGVSVNTVKSQIRQLFRKLNVDSRVALVRRCCP
jgi:DNA-binding NarL/FixJ family response regulator